MSKDLGAGRPVLFNGADAFRSASLYKLPIMVEVFRLRSEGSLSFAEELIMGGTFFPSKLISSKASLMGR